MLKILKITMFSIASFLILLVLTVIGYITYVSLQFYRIEDNKELEINNKQENIIKLNQELSFTSYNIGFGAYSHDYSFFMDKGYDKNGNLEHGKYGTARSKDEVLYNTNGAINIMKELNSDFYAIQEVDYDSTRSFKVDQIKMITDSFINHSSTFASNFHSAYLFYPFNNPHGKNNAGLLTLSKYKISESIRKSYYITEAFIDKFLDLDRCFSVNKIKVENHKELILINSHMSAYDEDGKIRNKQIEQLNNYMLEEYNKGNYVIVGGDFNHDLLTFNKEFNYTKENRPFNTIYDQKTPDWVSYMFDDKGESKFNDHFLIKASDDNPTVRGCDIGYIDGHTFVNTVDGFIISDNVKFESVSTINSNDDKTNRFAFSDHQATTLKFILE